MKHIACSGIELVLLLGLIGLPAGAQNQASSTAQNSSSGTSLGDYARQVRKDPGTASKPKVFDNDNLPREDKLSIVGQKPTETADAVPPTDNPPTPGEPKSGTDVKPGEAKAEFFLKAPSTTEKGTDDPASREAATKQW